MKKILFVDDNQSVLAQAYEMLQPMKARHQVTLVDSGEKALKLVLRDSYDIVISDIQMPGMNGAELLRHIQRHSPHTVRIILSQNAGNYELLRRMAELAHQFIAKPLDTKTLYESLEKALTLSDLVHNENLRRLLLGVRALPSYPGLYLEIIEELKKPNPSADHVGEIISRDMGMSAKVVQLVNSAYFGLSRNVTDPAQAAVMLGLETIRDLVLSLQVFSQFDMNKLHRLGLDGLWDHSLAVAASSRSIVRTMTSDKEMLNSAFLAGLLHDMGKLLLVEHFTMKYYSTVSTARQQNIPLFASELRSFGATHGHLGAYLLGCWGLPVKVVEALAYHHHLEHYSGQAFSLPLAIHVADALCHQAQTRPDQTPAPQVDTAYLEELQLLDRLPEWQEICQSIEAMG